jgi:hypothetical protein
LIRNLKSQVTAFESWQNNINSLSDKGIDQGLIKELQDMGPQSAAQIQALNKLSSDKLDQYVSLWRTKHEDAKKESIGELESMRINTLDQISELTKQASTELKNYKSTYESNLKGINDDTKKQLADLNTEWAKNMKLVSDNATTQVVAMTDGIVTSVTDMRKEAEQETSTFANNIKNIIGNIDDWYNIGASIIGGLTLGIIDTSHMLKEQVEIAAKSALDAAKTVLGIHSPSKAFQEVGMYSMVGFSTGLNNYSGLVQDSTTNVGYNAIDSLRSVMSRIGDVLNGDMDMNPTIRPVLDLGAVTDGIGTIDSLFNKRQSLSVTGVVDKASYTLNNLRNNSKVSQNGSSQSTPMVTDSSQSPIYVTVVSELDGREIARVTAPAMSEELYNLNKRKLW